MTDITSAEIVRTPAATGGGSVADFIALLKPRVMSLVIFTALVGLLLAPGGIHPVLGAVAILSIAVGAGASGALNMWYERDVDALMTRTARRPLPAGKMSPDEAAGFGITLSVGSVVVLGLATNWVAAGLLAFTIFFYVVIYTMWLKRSTPQNIVIGGAAGAFPPVVGWAAVTGSVAIEPIVLFAIIFMWTPPHFWALALVKNSDYTRAGIPMLPVVAGPDHTRLQILVYTLVLIPLTLAPVPLGFGGLVYGAVAAASGALMMLLTWRVFVTREGAAADTAAMQLFGVSILHLLLLFAALLVEVLTGRIAVPALFVLG